MLSIRGMAVSCVRRVRWYFLHRYSTENTGAYSTFKRSRLKPLSAQKLQTRRRSVPVFFRNLGFVKENRSFSPHFPLFRDRCFVQPRARARVPLPRLSGKAP